MKIGARRRLAAASVVALATGVLSAAGVVGARPASAVAGADLVVEGSTFDSTSSKSAIASCPPNKVLLGGGGRVVDGQGFVTMWSLTPTSGAYQADAYESAPFGGAWEVYAYAICGDPIAGHWITTNVATIAAGGQRGRVNAECPLGLKVIGAGGYVNGTGTSFEWIRPYDHGTYGEVVVEGIDDGSGAWEVGAIAVCASEPAGYQIGAVGTAAYTGPVLQISAACSGGRTLTGAGMTKWDASRTAIADAVFPTNLSTVWVNSRQPTASNPVYLGAWTICAN